jgi:hypothetical protein
MQKFSRIKIAAKFANWVLLLQMFDLHFTVSGDHVITVGGS